MRSLPTRLEPRTQEGRDRRRRRMDLNLVALHFSDSIQIVDLYHARQHLWEVARKRYPNNEGKQKPG